LEEAKKMCEKANASFVICGIDKDIRAVFKLVDLDKVVSICPTIDEAKDLIFMEELERDLLKDENNE
jgi:anti-anti-sigma regulatory factor